MNLVKSNSVTLLLRALNLVSVNCNCDKLRYLVKKICSKTQPEQKIDLGNNPAIGRCFDWPLFSYRRDKFDTSSFPSNALIKLLETVQRPNQLHKLVPYLQTRTHLITHCPLLYDPKTCRQALFILDQNSDVINIWLEGLIMRIKNPPDSLLQIVTEYAATIDFLCVFVNSTCQNSCIPNLWFYEYLPYFNLTRRDASEKFRFFLRCLANLKCDSLKRLVPRLDTETLLLVGHYCLFNPKKFRECVWPELCSRYENSDDHTLAEDVYFLKSKSVYQSLILQWGNNSRALDSFHPDSIVHILDCIRPEKHVDLPIKFLRLNPEYISHVHISNDTPYDTIQKLGFENLSREQLLRVNWPEFISSGNDIPTAYLQGLIVDSNIDLLQAAHETVQIEIDNNDTCRICFCDLEDQELVQLACNHVFHSDCFTRWSQNTCPLCRQEAY